jgi:hypothetical protein
MPTPHGQMKGPQDWPRSGGAAGLQEPLHWTVPPQLLQDAPRLPGVATEHWPLQAMTPPHEPHD